MKQGCGRVLYASVLTLLLVIPYAHAITIDDFNSSTDQVVLATSGSTQSSGFSAQNALGARRVLSAVSQSGLVTASVTQDSGLYGHSQNVLSQGATSILWDGGLDATVSPEGLGPIDLTEDGGTALTLVITFLDLNGAPLTARFVLYDSNGQGVSSATTTLSTEVLGADPPLTISVPFASFTALGGAPAARMTSIGAIRLEFSGGTQAVDLAVDLVGTNGSCPLVPSTPEGVLDQCGVCGGDNSSCADCLGVPNGTAQPGSQCPTGIPGQCAPGSYTQACACVPNVPASAEQCDSIDNDCDGLVDEDVGPCEDCAGQAGGTAVLDRCGVCQGQGDSCLGCTDKDLEDLLRALDGGAKRQEGYIKRILRPLNTLFTKKMRKEVQALKSEAHELQIRNWILSWTVPVQSTVCENSQFCSSVSHAWIIDEYRQNSERLRKLGLRAVAIAKRVSSPSSRALAQWKSGINELHKKNMELADTVPLTQSFCAP